MNEKKNIKDNNSSHINNNNYILNKLRRENYELKETIGRLQSINIRITSENEELKILKKLLLNKEKEYLVQQGLITEQETEMEYLKNIILAERKNFFQDLRLKEKSYENELLQMKRDHDMLKKIENFNKINSLNDIFYSKILDLEKTIEDLKKEEEIKLNMKEIEFNNKMDKYKKKLLDFLKKGDIIREGGDQLALSNKMNMLHIQELLNEIEYQNQEVNDLLKQRKELKIKIIDLSSDLNIYKIMVNILANKNDEFQKKLKSAYKPFKEKLSSNLNKIIPKIENHLNLNINTEICDKKFKIYSPKLNKKNLTLNSDLPSNKTKKSSNFFYINNTISSNASQKKIKLESESSIASKMKQNDLFNEKKEKEKFKDLYEFYKKKYEYYHNKFKNIIETYESMLEKIYNEELTNKKKDIIININDFKDFNFENMTPEQKYSVLIKLINHIAPLVYKNDFEDNSFRGKIFKVKQKYNIFKSNNKSKFSRTQKSFEKYKKTEPKETKLTKSIQGCTISTYFSSEKRNKEEKKILNFNKHYMNLIKFSQSKKTCNISQNMKIPTFDYNNNIDIHDSPFTYY